MASFGWRAKPGTVVCAALVFLASSLVTAPEAQAQPPLVLSIIVPDGPVSVGSGSPGTQISGQLGTVLVTDNRLIAGAWTASVSATSFTTGGASAPERILDSSLAYWSGPASTTTGLGTFVPGQPSAANAVTLNTSQVAFRQTLNVLGTAASWNPTIVVNIPAQAVAGTYTGVIVHSVT